MFACVHIPNFSLAAVVRTEPDLRLRPLAIYAGKAPLEILVAVNEIAAGLGITTGMTKPQAELCTELTLRPQSSVQEDATHAALLDCVHSFSPSVEDYACDTSLLDLSGMSSLFGSFPEIAQAISARAARLGLAAHVAIAANPDAAMLAARGFPGVIVIPQGQEAAQLGRLPVNVLFSDQKDSEQQKADQWLATFERWGIRDLHALAALPEIALSERLGQPGLRLQKLARGAALRSLVMTDEPMIFEEKFELEHPITLLEPLAFLLNHLLEQLCHRLASRALCTQELRLTLELVSFCSLRQSTVKNSFVRILRLPLPMLDAKVFLKLLQLDLNAHPPGAPIMKIHLAMEPTRPRSAQAGLFTPPAPEPEKLELTLARIAAIVGEQKVGALELLDTHQPEGFRMRRFASEPQKITKTALQENLQATGVTENAAVTALRHFRPALRAEVTLENGQPVELTCKKMSSSKREVSGPVLWKAGPWRFSGNWWDREAWSRDEWDIALSVSQSRSQPEISFYRLVHDLLRGQWFLEGTYD